jgi:hypothetical protein
MEGRSESTSEEHPYGCLRRPVHTMRSCIEAQLVEKDIKVRAMIEIEPSMNQMGLCKTPAYLRK